jgi:hypothetical protein
LLVSHDMYLSLVQIDCLPDAISPRHTAGSPA